MAVSRSISVMNGFLKTEARRDRGRRAGEARRCSRIFGTDNARMALDRTKPDTPEREIANREYEVALIAFRLLAEQHR
jgi:hypothetical protein